MSETILSLAARKALGVPPAKGVASTTDVASEHSWVWEVTILDILPLDFVTRAVKPVRAARRKLSVRVKATHRVTEVCRKTPGDADKINGEEEKVLKYEREDEAVRLKEELKEEEKLKKFQSKLAESKLKEETKGAKLAVKEQQKVENDAMKAEEVSPTEAKRGCVTQYACLLPGEVVLAPHSLAALCPIFTALGASEASTHISFTHARLVPIKTRCPFVRSNLYVLGQE